jgi:hypothetical protein
MEVKIKSLRKIITLKQSSQYNKVENYNVLMQSYKIIKKKFVLQLRAVGYIQSNIFNRTLE